jgi:hypothetical protein
MYSFFDALIAPTFVADFASGVRIASSVLWAWVLWRIAFESWRITEAPSDIRARGWIHFRRFLFLIGFAIVFIFNPVAFIKMGGHYSETLEAWRAVGVLITTFCAILIHHGLDIVQRRPPSTLAIYFMLLVLSLVYTLTRGWL